MLELIPIAVTMLKITEINEYLKEREKRIMELERRIIKPKRNKSTLS